MRRQFDEDEAIARLVTLAADHLKSSIDPDEWPQDFLLDMAGYHFTYKGRRYRVEVKQERLKQMK